jgi:uroporphyrinogen decarboxylase
MNKIERLRATLQNQPVDRVPVGFWFHFDPAYAGGEAMANRHLAYYRATDLDVLKVMNDTAYTPLDDLKIVEPEDWYRLEPMPLSDPVFQRHLEGLKRIVDAVGHEVLIMTTAFNPYHRAVHILRGGRSVHHNTPADWARTAFWQQARTAPEAIHYGLQVIAQSLAEFYVACIQEAGANGIYFSAQGGESALISDAEHTALLKPYDLYLLQRVQPIAEFVLGHFCGKGISLHRFTDYPVQIANWAHQSGNLSLGEGKRLLGGVPTLGGLDERGTLVTGPREALRREIAQTLESMGTRGFMLGAGCTLPGDIDLGHIIYAREVAAELSRG